MNKAKLNFKIVVAALVIGLSVTVSTSFADWGNGMGYSMGMNHGMDAVNTHPALTAEQQQQINVVKEKYSQQLDELQASLNSKSFEYQTASTNDNTTVGTLKRLKSEMKDLERQYWTLLDQANNEAGQFIAGSHNQWFDCGYSGCNHQNHMGNMSQGRHMGPGHRNEMVDRNMACRW